MPDAVLGRAEERDAASVAAAGSEGHEDELQASQTEVRIRAFFSALCMRLSEFGDSLYSFDFWPLWYIYSSASARGAPHPRASPAGRRRKRWWKLCPSRSAVDTPTAFS